MRVWRANAWDPAARIISHASVQRAAPSAVRGVLSAAGAGAACLEQARDIDAQDLAVSEALHEAAQEPLAVLICLRQEPVVDPRPVAPVLHDSGGAQHREVARYIRLRQAERLLQVADAQFTVREERDDAQTRLVAERLEQAGDGLDLELRDAVHAQ
jgi:hypothetical protein